MPIGRPTDYKEEYDEQTFKLCLLGATDESLADFFDVAVSTIGLWKIKHPTFSEAIKRGKMKADAEVAQSLYHRAKGYQHPEDKVFCTNGEVTVVPTTKYYPPDTAAAFIWLKNRASWRDRQEHTGADGGPIKYESMDDAELEARIKALENESKTSKG